MTDANLMVGWELGEGLGHIGAIAGVLERLPPSIHVVAVVRNPERAKKWFPPSTILVQAPPLQPEPPPITVTYGDVLYGLGWHRTNVLRELVAEWHALFERFSPSALLLECAPGALLANRDAKLPVVCFSSPWNNPAGGNPMGPVLTTAMEGGRRVAAEREREIVEAINTITTAPLDGLSRLFSDHHHFIKSVPQGDPNHGRRDGPVTHLGPMGFDGGGEDVAFPSGQGSRIFCYLKPTYDQLTAVLNELAMRGNPTLAYVPGHREVTRGNLRVVGHAVHLHGLVETADLVITHSIVGTGYLFAASGVPVLLLPTHSEQLSNAIAASSLGGVEWMSSPAVLRELRPRLKQMLQPEMRLKAVATADHLSTYPDPFQRVADAVLAALS